MKVEVLEYDNYSKIHYYNDGMSYRVLILDNNKHIIQDEISEYDPSGKLIADVVFGIDHTTIIGMRKYTEHGFEDYRKLNDKLILTQSQKTEWIEVDKKAKTSFYDTNGDLVYYDIFEKDDDCGMVIMGSFDKNDIQFFWDNSPNEVKLLQSYSDY
ncbi:hypothetical protein NKT77_00710 [Moraxella sp. FZLJ2107]|uniref:hypothetical protein n=1 Tax=unclassified Moraxella TaxID=2685852 RepID=UPI00209BD5A4|nr:MULTISPECIES: hypothetical protein [unclassified Moraxella]USZ14544.1 hypothetical protein NGM44_09280 [Moraxella sp. FZFQ2102]UTO05215.1 hypothetical protein NKT77_00710 [Moraxella sp. FZLJ2107]UTO21950.1 hypothetical protein NKU06_09010 [Moraxella sp. FZLJ2109]